MKRWQKRWFVMAGHYLRYYKSKPKEQLDPSELRGAIDLNHVLEVRGPGQGEGSSSLTDLSKKACPYVYMCLCGCLCVCVFV